MRAIWLVAAALAAAWGTSVFLGSEPVARERGTRYAPPVAAAPPLPREWQWQPPAVSVETMYGTSRAP